MDERRERLRLVDLVLDELLPQQVDELPDGIRPSNGAAGEQAVRGLPLRAFEREDSDARLSVMGSSPDEKPQQG